MRFLAQLQVLADATMARLSGGHDSPALQPRAGDPQPHLLLMQRYLEEVDAALRRDDATPGQYLYGRWGAVPIRELPSVQAILTGPPELQVAVVRSIVAQTFPAALPHTLRTQDLDMYFTARRLGELANLLLQRKLTYSTDDIEALLLHLTRDNLGWREMQHALFSVQTLLRSIARCLANEPLPPAVAAALTRLHENLISGYSDARCRKAVELIEELLGIERSNSIFQADDWGHYALAMLSELDTTQRERWLPALTLASGMTSTKPTKQWLDRARELIEELGEREFVALAAAFLGLLDRPTRGELYRRPDGLNNPTAMIAQPNADVVKGLAWMASTVADERLALVLADAALACFKKIPGHGARSVKAGNACVHALGALDTLDALIQLRRLNDRLKLPSARAQVLQALSESAERLDISLEDLDDLATPTFGLVDGVTRIEIGEYVAVLSVAANAQVTLSWLRPDGKPQKSVPAEVKRTHALDLKDVQRTRKGLGEALLLQRDRIERLLARRRAWSLADWHSRYIDHPLTGLLARRLIWSFEHDGRTLAGIWDAGRIVDASGAALELPSETQVRIWHPIEARQEEVVAWREWLEARQITQPFKQAHREIYVLTDAELQTETYSNRFAAHILRQHQFNALCQQRGWRYSLQGAWDGHNVPTVELPEWELKAEFWVEGVQAEDNSGLSHTGIYLYVTTDQVRFYPPNAWEPLRLADVPARIFSEVMRDVDLFVGVGSIGADPNWLDGGVGRINGYRDYWWSTSFGELSASARMRREVLERLLPRMAKLEGRWELDERFLKIQGELRAYKIHLGSGNILMSPNDQYLCIVPGRGAGSAPGDGLFLPFEGDQTLAVILSKALMLAEDTRIKDPTITRQINRP